MPKLRGQSNATDVPVASGWDKVIEYSKKFVANKFYAATGFNTISKPEVSLVALPNNLGATADVMLSELLANYSIWKEYAQDLKIRAMAEYNFLNSSYQNKFAKTAMSSTFKNSKDRVLVAEANDELHGLYEKVVEAETYLDMLNEKITSLSDSISVISREISLRKK